MLTMARYEKDAVSIAEALWSALKAHPVGHLQPKLQSHSTPGEPVNFLGHRLKLNGQTVKITPSPENEYKFQRRLKSGFATIKNPCQSDFMRRAKARDLKGYIASWTANFSRCDGMAERRVQMLSQVDTIMKH